jgi:hypothetical protein
MIWVIAMVGEVGWVRGDVRWWYILCPTLYTTRDQKDLQMGSPRRPLREVAGNFWRSCWELLDKSQGASTEVAGSEKLLGTSGEVAGSLYRNCWEPLQKLLGASREVAGSLLRNFWKLLEKL